MASSSEKGRGKNTIRQEDIQAKDIERRPFLARVSLLTGTIGSSALFAGCNSVGNSGPDRCRYDTDPHNPIRCDSD